jgi:hypothetical protein
MDQGGFTYICCAPSRNFAWLLDGGTSRSDALPTGIVALERQNFNTRIIGHGFLVALGSADGIVESLTTTPEVGSKLLPFGHYI